MKKKNNHIKTSGRICQITKKCPTRGNSLSRSGIAKKKKGIGLNRSGVSRRTFRPNIFKKRLWNPEKKCFEMVKLSMKALRTINKKGASKVLSAL